MAMALTLNLNGIEHKVDAAPDTPLLWVIREHLGLTGTKYSCGVGQCGACSVIMDGRMVRSCLLPVSQAANRRITTIEGADSKAALALKQAWEQLQVPQCGFCQSGQLITATVLLTGNPKPTDKEIDAVMNGNICRCNTYARIRRAIKLAAATLD
jgi:isoquinoline 1-oxidoreductase alpha subunit